MRRHLFTAAAAMVVGLAALAACSSSASADEACPAKFSCVNTRLDTRQVLLVPSTSTFTLPDEICVRLKSFAQDWRPTDPIENYAACYRRKK